MFADNDSAHNAEPMCDNPVVTFVTRARDGDERAWAALVEWYAPLIWSLCAGTGWTPPTLPTSARTSGYCWWTSWARCAIRPRFPAGLPLQPGGNTHASWTERRCRTLQGTSRTQRTSRTARPKRSSTGLLAAEQHAALREAFTHLPRHDQQLIALLIEDPPVSYAQISARLGIPVGSIGPNRRRCLDKLRHHPAIAVLISAEAQTA
jgi:hypothetical protein